MRTIIYKVVDKILESEFGYFKNEEDAKDELRIQLERISSTYGGKFEIKNNGYIGTVIGKDGNKADVISIRAICLR